MADFAEDYARNLAEAIRKTARDRDYIRWALEARRQYVNLRLRQDSEIRKLYLRAAARASALLGTRNRSSSDVVLRRRLDHLIAELREIADEFGESYKAAMGRHIEEGVEAGAGFSRAVTLELGKTAGWDGGKLREIFAKVNKQAVEACWARTKNGLRLSDRVWQQARNVEQTMAEIIQEAAAVGQDAVETARMLERYIRNGSSTLAKDYPNMMKRLRGRVPGNLTYEGLRLARTEMTAAYGEGTISAARVSPSYQGMKWVLSLAHPLPDICDELASRDDFGLGPGVYAPGNEPMYPAHPNDLCYLVPVHETPEEFVERLKRWRRDPGAEPELEQWYNLVYKQVA